MHYNIKIKAKIDEQAGRSYLDFYYENSETGEFVKWLSQEEMDHINKQIREHVIENADKIYVAMGTGKSLGEVNGRG